MQPPLFTASYKNILNYPFTRLVFDKIMGYIDLENYAENGKNIHNIN